MTRITGFTFHMILTVQSVNKGATKITIMSGYNRLYPNIIVIIFIATIIQ